jgi:DNA-binding CsgD family transcriptional regulator
MTPPEVVSDELELDASASVEELLIANQTLRARLAFAHRLGEALDELRELGPVSEILEHAPRAAAHVAGLDRAVLSRIQDGSLIAESVFISGDSGSATAMLADLQALPTRIEYPLVEGEILRRRRPLLIQTGDTELQGRAANTELLAWKEFIVAPAILDGRVIAFLHGDRFAGGQPLGEAERDALWSFTKGFAAIFERAILRHRLRVQRREMRQIASWADAKTSELSDRQIDLTTDREQDAGGQSEPSATPDSALRDLLTRREVDVLELMVKGETNAGIARGLVVSEGTVKFHVKNILRKLHASNRAEATSRYLRLTLGRDGGTNQSRWPD